MHHGFITPVPLHYVRNHGPVPKASWKGWTVEVTGLVKRPNKFTMAELVNKFPRCEFHATLVCAGNRRKEQNMVKNVIGFNWGAAGVSTSAWCGVPLHVLLKHCGIMSTKKGSLNVCFEGAEDLPGDGGGSKYGTSIKKDIAMDPSRDIMLAYMQNGKMLTPDHGFPVRMLIPGFIGGRMVKWLKRIVVTENESDNYYHFKDNRVLPSHVDAKLADSEEWWKKPEFIINELNINSVITTPCHEEILLINSCTIQQPYFLKGYSYSGGGKKVTRVEVTMDGGDTWHICSLDHPEKPNKYGRYWCWCFWSLEVEMIDLLATKEIAVRAWDETLNTQPEKLIWNVMGMMNNCWFRVRINKCKPQEGEIKIVFEHPTQPGNQSGGWMANERRLEKSSHENHTLKKSVASPSMNTTSKKYSISEVEKNRTKDSAWIIVHGHVYDCTPYLGKHPAGADGILINAGTDCTEDFDGFHSDQEKKLLENYRIGEVTTTESSPTKNVASEKIRCKLVKKENLSRDVRLLRFELPYDNRVLELPIGKQIVVCAVVDKNPRMRAYTPLSVETVGCFDLIIKIYSKGVHLEAVMSRHLASLETGSFIDVKSPQGHIEYTGRGNFLVHGKRKFATKLAMLAGGTGITPIYQVMQAILKDPEDKTEMHVIYANRTEEDILFREELDSWAKNFPERVKVWYVVGESSKDDWKYSVGHISESILREHIPVSSESTLALACGPPLMLKNAVKPNLEKMGYDTKESLLEF